MLDTRIVADLRAEKMHEVLSGNMSEGNDALSDLGVCVSELYDALAEIAEMMAEMAGGE